MFFDGISKFPERSGTHVVRSSFFPDSDRRYIPRWQVKNRVMYVRAGEESFHICSSRDINCMGACIYTDEEILLNEQLNVTIYLTEDVSVSVIAKVVWEKPDGNFRILGLHFENVSDRVRDLIFNYAFEYKKDELVKNWFRGL